MGNSFETAKLTRRATGRARGRVVAVILSGAMLSVVALAPAAHAADTTTTFSLTAGALSVSAPATAALANAATGATSLSGSLGTTQVTDARGGTAGWVTTAASDGFAGPSTAIANSAVAYTGGLATTSGVVTALSTAVAAAMTTPVTAMSGTVVVGNNTASWNPTIGVTLPSNALAGAYSGIITHSVV